MTLADRPARSPGTLREAAARTERRLDALAPELVDGFRAALPRAAQTVGRRLLGALWREQIGDARQRYARAGRRHAFDRTEFDAAPADEPAALLPPSVVGRGGAALAGELTDAVVNLALAYARGTPPPDGAGADGRALDAERRAVDGHNLHPCGRTRLGWDVADVLRHDLEAGTTGIGFVAVRRDLHLGDDVGAALADAYPEVPAAPPGFVVQPVHIWQRDAVLRRRYADLVAAGALRPLEGTLPAAPTAALRTLLLPPGRDGRRRHLKVSLDIQVTSTRRTISVASTRNGPALTALLERLFAEDPDADRVLLLPETAGAAVPAGSGRDMSVILRGGLDDRLSGAEQVVPGTALTAGGVLGDLVDRYAPEQPRAAAALGFVTAYARLLLPPLLRLATRYGIALEAHLQNCLPTFVNGTPHRLVLRDFAGLRVLRPRLAAAGVRLPLWPGSVIGTDDAPVMRAKLGYTALQAHLGELVVRLTASHGLDEAAAWRAVRGVVDEAYEPLRAEPATAAAADADHAALTAGRVPHKALVRMRLVGSGDVHVPVQNPLHVR
ncbi:Siderophore synthetase component [Micromonospora pattaloongensis]|uniref:Siderophore synthetase component n=1 Tax=Micromonospora pattaloongensis TaxID=405436 RepID=A0A1H3P345_9ACTN|nr:IucA/IucC family protein [Micromonospora pattaloongensis]SDY95537.1 Siderophore synthetase component [Micromonospora pattaloongensis]